MRLSRSAVLIAFLLVVALTSSAEAKWWIFGAGEDEVQTNYLFLNKVSFSELGTKVTLFRDTLPSGMVSVQGRASAGMQKIGGVRISLDGKDTWMDAKLSDNGAFEYSFRPDLGRTYKIYVEVTDTRGKTNKIEDTYKELIVSDLGIQGIVNDVLNKLIDAYQRENASQFMALVSENYAGDKTPLDRAVRSDFRAFDNISLRYTLSNVTSAASGKVFVVLNFVRQVTSVRTGRTLQDRGTTQFTFLLGDKGLKLWDMKIPLIFGLSDPRNVATGVTNTASPENVIVVDNAGNVNTVSVQAAAQQFQSGTTSQSSAIQLTCSGIGPAGPNCQGFTFASGAVGPATGNQDLQLAEFGGLFFRPNTLHLNLGVINFDSLTSVPATGLHAGEGIFDLAGNVGHTFALKLPTGQFAAIFIQSFVQNGQASSILRLRYKFQPNGTPQF